MNLAELLVQNNEQLRQNELIILGQIEKHKEELIKVRAKIIHNTDLIGLLNAANTNPAASDSEEQPS